VRSAQVLLRLSLWLHKTFWGKTDKKLVRQTISDSITINMQEKNRPFWLFLPFGGFSGIAGRRFSTALTKQFQEFLKRYLYSITVRME
jgi:hypothetical protein